MYMSNVKQKQALIEALIQERRILAERIERPGATYSPPPSYEPEACIFVENESLEATQEAEAA